MRSVSWMSHASRELSRADSNRWSSQRSVHNRWTSASGRSAHANATVPPASCQACARARQRMTCPVPMTEFASARIKSFPGVAGEFCRMISIADRGGVKHPRAYARGSPGALASRLRKRAGASLCLCLVSFLLDVPIDLGPVRVLLQKFQHVEPAEVSVSKVGADPLQEFVILGSVDRPAVAGGLGPLGLHERDAESLG